MKIRRAVMLLAVAVGLMAHLGFMTAPGTNRSPVQVFVHKNAKPGAVTYDYRVVNSSAFEITALDIGYDYYTNSPQLRIAPIGWDGDSVPRKYFRSPQGWQFVVTQTEDDSLVYLQWVADSLTTGILGGTTKSGFEVTLPGEDARYVGGKWVVYLNSASKSYYAGSIVTNAPPSSVHDPQTQGAGCRRR